jgi:hypothetical protein
MTTRVDDGWSDRGEVAFVLCGGLDGVTAVAPEGAGFAVR